MLDRLRHAVLSAWARWVCDHPRATLAIALVLAALSVAYTWRHLEFAPDRNDLISPKLDWNRRYIEYRRDFFGQDRIIVVVQPPESPDAADRARRFVDELAARLEADRDHVRKVWSTIQGPPILMRLLPLEEFTRRIEQLAQAGPLLQSPNVAELMTRMTAALSGSENGGSVDLDQVVGQLEGLRRLIDAIGDVMAGGEPGAAFSIESLFGEPSHQYLTSSDGKLYFLDIDARPAEGQVDAYAPAVAAVRRVVAELRRRHPGMDTGLTGIPVLEADETAVSLKDSTLSGIYSAIAIGVILVVAYHGWQKPLLALASLMVGVAWSFGFLTLAVGHLQVLSVVFTTILFGLGIDFGVHLMSRYELVRERYGAGVEGCRQAIIDVAQNVGPGMVTAAVTSALAFSTTLLTDFTGMAEMGLIAGVGVLLCLAAMWSVFPAAMILLRPHAHQVTAHQDRLINLHSLRYLEPLLAHPRLTVAATALIAAAGGYGLWHTRFDNNLMNMLPDGLESVVWQQAIADHSDQAIWSAVTIASSLDQARELTDRIRRLPGVASVGGAGLLFPEDEQPKLELIRRTRAAMEPALARAAIDSPSVAADPLRAQFTAMGLALSVAQGRQEVRDDPRLAGALASVARSIQKALSPWSDPSQQPALAGRAQRLHQAYQRLRAQAAAMIGSASADRPLELADLPDYLQREAISKTEPTRFQLQAYPREDVWDPAKLEPFLADLRRIDPLVTGSPVQIHESGALMRRAYQTAGAIAIAAVLLVVLIDLRNLLDALLCLLPVGLGFVTTFGVMWLFDVAVNPANLIVLPLMFGIGVASGVNILHRYRMHPEDHPLGLAGGTGKSILLTSATTIAAFLAMLPADHRGIRSLGIVLSLGLTLTLLASMTVMPAILKLRQRRAA